MNERREEEKKKQPTKTKPFNFVNKLHELTKPIYILFSGLARALIYIFLSLSFNCKCPTGECKQIVKTNFSISFYFEMISFLSIGSNLF